MLQFVQPKIVIPPAVAARRPAPAVRLNPQKQYFLASTHIDVGGCSYYRILFISQLLSQVHTNLSFWDARLLFQCTNLFPALSSFRLQRACGLRDVPWFEKTLLPARRAYGFPVVYEIDDILVRDDIPEYNCYRDIFREGAQAIPVYMNGADVVTVTCAPLADYYSRKFGIPRAKFRVIPNYLPRFFFDSCSEPVVRDRIATQKSRKPRICFSCGVSHFDMNRVGSGDDFSGILDWIVQNRARYQFIFHGGFPPALERYAADFERVPVGPFLDYPRVRRSLRADLFIQPLKRSLFNECKSPIKLLESWAEGVPAFVQDLSGYRAIAPEACFDTPQKLDRMVRDLFADPEEQFRLIRRNYARMDAFWLDNHLDDWLQVLLRPAGR